uniref:Glycosyl transferase family 11 n=1 Tax=Candidatus Kentrum sp. FW TaxID=2126338 RepID=A0A450TY95_9GAMM|nr:MAG: Glycosyl transferase family 11 [Candidatus Kentron sp. FW]
MIFTQLIGGLGNQMFQYAAGRALSLRRGVPLAIDRRGFDEYILRNYGLDKFVLQAVDADPRYLPPLNKKKRITRLFKRFGLGTSYPRVFREKAFEFYPEVLDLPDGTYLKGYWQSERYFLDAQDTIRRDFAFRHPPSPINADYLGQIRQGISVSVHIRRGDYVSDKAASALIGTCSFEYYQRAARLLEERVESTPRFYVFSDDPDWARTNMKFNGEMHIVRHNDASTDFEDLRLMSACSHHIIANSTFSWWAAWLNPSPDKIVIAPARWFRSDKLDDKDLIPSKWLRV